jgi:hypothetical protein
VIVTPAAIEDLVGGEDGVGVRSESVSEGGSVETARRPLEAVEMASANGTPL